jgi:shikimate kinase
MIILLFGTTNVGKTTTGKILAKELHYRFFDLDDEVKKYYHITIEEFVKIGTLEERDRKRKKVLNELVKKGGNSVIAITPISYPEVFNHHLKNKNILSIELRDTVEHIFDRLIFSDENDQEYSDDAYKNKHKNHYMHEIQADINWYSNKVYRGIVNKFDMKNDTPTIVVERLIQEYKLHK